jgi:tRNA U34 2-thiouridine synthase MnmA/TrmU
MHVRFEEGCNGVAPGQLAVVFEEDRVLGGAWIERMIAASRFDQHLGAS